MMDMSTGSGSGLPWLDQPVVLHSSRADNCTLSPKQCAYRRGHWRYWYQADHVYALNTVYFMCATIGIFAIAHLLSRYAPIRMKRSAVWQKTTAVTRYLAYKGFQLPALRCWSPSLGVILLGFVGTAFFFAMILGPKPYYWPNTAKVSYGSSPPIATRTGWMALALLPFVLALGTKANLISMLTGVPHEKLQVFHHWASYAMFVLALVHTFPFIVYHNNKGDMVKQWNTSLTYWTGVAALIPQAYLTLMSLPFIRNRYYEFFKATHFIVALLFILFFFFHCDFRLTSWDYFIAAGAIYMFSLGAAQIRTYLMHGLHSATVDLLPCGLLRVKIPTIVNWKPGQHMFIRFINLQQLGLHCLTAHPFTICSLSHNPDRVGKACEIIFYVKPKRGMTARLAKIAAKCPGYSMTVLLEGPYGGLSNNTNLGRFDTILVVSGGSGGGFSLAIVEEALRAYGPEYPSVDESVSRTIQVIFATRDKAVAEWYADEIDAKVSTYNVPAKQISLFVHVTSSQSHVQDPAAELKDQTSGEENKQLSSTELTSAQSILNTAQQGRSNLPDIIASMTTCPDTKRIGIFVCGPASMLHDVRNAAAQAQREVLKNRTVEEVYLHMEPFSW